MRQIIFLLAVSVFICCKGKSDYEMKVYYMKLNSSGNMILVHDSKDITAQNDSLAYRQAVKKYRYIRDNNKNQNRVPKNFELFDYKGKEVIDVNYDIFE